MYICMYVCNRNLSFFHSVLRPEQTESESGVCGDSLSRFHFPRLAGEFKVGGTEFEFG
jgi:hypothetical protein